jgi:hypothetical protein
VVLVVVLVYRLIMIYYSACSVLRHR